MFEDSNKNHNIYRLWYNKKLKEKSYFWFQSCINYLVSLYCKNGNYDFYTINLPEKVSLPEVEYNLGEKHTQKWFPFQGMHFSIRKAKFQDQTINISMTMDILET